MLGVCVESSSVLHTLQITPDVQLRPAQASPANRLPLLEAAYWLLLGSCVWRSPSLPNPPQCPAKFRVIYYPRPTNSSSCPRRAAPDIPRLWKFLFWGHWGNYGKSEMLMSHSPRGMGGDGPQSRDVPLPPGSWQEWTLYVSMYPSSMHYLI